MIIPEYKIDLMNKNNKILKTFEHLRKISLKDKIIEKNIKDKTKGLELKSGQKTKLVKKKQAPKTLWVRRKKRVKSNPFLENLQCQKNSFHSPSKK